MAETIYDPGDLARLTTSFTDFGTGNPVDPTTVTADVRDPDGNTTTYILTSGQIVKDSTGNYHLDIQVATPGRWSYKFVGTGAATDTGQGTFVVRDDLTTGPQDYVSIDELKAALQLTTQTYADGDIARACSAASRAIDLRCGRVFYPADQTRYYTPDPCDSALDIIDIQTVTSFTVDTAGNGTFATTWVAGTDFDLEPYNAATTGRPYERVRLRPQAGRRWPTTPRSISVAGTFGWATVPDPVNQYALILASKLLDRARKSPNGILSFGLDAPIAMRIARNDPDFELLLGGYDLSKPGA